MELVVISISLIIGVLFFYSIKVNGLILFFACVLSIVSYIVLNKGKKIIIIFIYIFIGGILINNFLDNSILINLLNKEIKIVGVVKEIVRYEDYNRLTIKVENLAVNNNFIDMKEDAILYSRDHYEVGDRVKGKVSVEEIKPNTNKNLFNYRNYLLGNKIYVKLEITEDLIKVGEENINFFKKISDKLSNNVKGNIDKFIYNSSIIKSIIFGDESYLDKNQLEIYRSLGVAHILAVSGLHVGILFAFLIYIFNLIHINKQKKVLVHLL